MTKLTKAERKMLICIGKRWSGKSSYVKTKKDRARAIARAIDTRFNVHIYQYQLKHIRWYVEHELAKKVKGTITNYRPVVFGLVELIGDKKSWLPHVQKTFEIILRNKE